MENNQNKEKEIEIDLKQIFFVLLSRIWIIVLVGIVCGVMSFSYFKFVAVKQYTSTTQIFVMDKESDKITSSDLSMYSALLNDYLQMVQTRPVLEKVIAELGLDMKSEQLKSKITASKEGESRIIAISVTDESPIVAKRIADSVAKAATEQIYKVMETEMVNIVQPGNVPESPSSPATARNAVIAAVLGIVITCAVIIIRFLMDDTIKVSDDAEKYLGISVIGNIPLFGEEAEVNSQKKGKNRKKSENTHRETKNIRKHSSENGD